jgi:uncharacterized protein involved in propanediol utilization
MRAAATISSRARSGSASGTCGELLQGVLPGGRHFHVTCPIERGVEVTVRLTPAPFTRIEGLPRWATTTTRALHRATEFLELGPVLIEVEHATCLIPSKGMASSTADVVAAVRALSAAAGQALDAQTLAQIATSIEASDGVMHDGIVALAQHDGSLLHSWEWSPRFHIAMFVPPQDRVTADVLPRSRPGLQSTYACLLEAFDAAMRSKDAAAIARIATRSAELNDTYVPNPLLTTLRGALAAAGAAGLCVGHSGTVCGLLFLAGHGALAAAAAEALLPALPAGTDAVVTRLAG